MASKCSNTSGSRLVPLAIAVLSYQFLFGLFFNGPLMPYLNDPMTEDCAKHWWYLLVGYYDIRDESAVSFSCPFPAVKKRFYGIFLIESQDQLKFANHFSPVPAPFLVCQRRPHTLHNSSPIVHDHLVKTQIRDHLAFPRNR